MIYYITARMKSIFVIDYSKGESSVKVIEEAKNHFLKNPCERFLVLTNVTGAVANQEYREKVKKYAPIFDRQAIKTCVIGLDLPKKIMLATYNMFAQKKKIAFNTEKEAIEYLIA